MMGEVGLEIRKGCLRHLDDCEISARFYGLKSWRLPTHLGTSALQITIFYIIIFHIIYMLHYYILYY